MHSDRIPLVSEEKPDENKATSSQDKIVTDARKAADNLLRDLQDKVTPWALNDLRTDISFVIATFTSVASASSAGYFANKLFEGEDIKKLIPENKKSLLKTMTAIAATPPATLLSFNASFGVWNQLLRALPYITSAEVKRNALPLLLTSLSAVVSFKVNWDAFQGSPLWLRILAASGKAGSSLSLNGAFAFKTLNNIRGTRKAPETHLLLDVRKKLQFLAKHDSEAYIKTVSDSRLFENILRIRNTTSGDSQADVNHIFSSLFAVIEDTPDTHSSSHVTRSCKSSAIAIGALSLGVGSAVSYLNSGQKVVSGLFGLTSPYWLYSLGSVFGISAMAINSAIAAIAVHNAITRLSEKQCSGFECITLPFNLYFLLGYSLSNAGLALQYPSPVDNKVLGWIEASISFLVYLGIGDMAFDKFFSSLSNGYSVHVRKVLEAAKDAGEKNISLLDYYHSLRPLGEEVDADNPDAPNSDQRILIRVMEDYFTWAFEALVGFFNHANTQIIDTILEHSVKNKLEAFELHRQRSVTPPSPTYDPPATLIRVDITETKDQPVTAVPDPSVIYQQLRLSRHSKPTEFDPAPFDALPMVYSSSPNIGLRRRTMSTGAEEPLAATTRSSRSSRSSV